MNRPDPISVTFLAQLIGAQPSAVIDACVVLGIDIDGGIDRGEVPAIRAQLRRWELNAAVERHPSKRAKKKTKKKGTEPDDAA